MTETILKKLDIVGAKHQHAIIDNLHDKGISDIEILNLSTPATLGVKTRIEREVIPFLNCFSGSAAISRLIESLDTKKLSIEDLFSIDESFGNSLGASCTVVRLFLVKNNGAVVEAPFRYREWGNQHEAHEEDNSEEFNEFIAEHISDTKYIVETCREVYDFDYITESIEAKRVVLK
jgi:hypothetical protein